MQTTHIQTSNATNRITLPQLLDNLINLGDSLERQLERLEHIAICLGVPVTRDQVSKNTTPLPADPLIIQKITSVVLSLGTQATDVNDVTNRILSVVDPQTPNKVEARHD